MTDDLMSRDIHSVTLLPVSLPTLALMWQCRDTQQDTPFLLFPQLPHVSTFPEHTTASEWRVPRNYQ